ncbi:hypothetical protein [uncultured Polaribacter sp.]|uniref:hypothetical protein n=1 Tax=uncultured Polaribacter sp. TaxID=174711 RepID=UPI0026067D5A|nr:hypothetical protein [uncultured Polaribacter sp.]
MKLTETHIQELYKFTRKHFVEHYDVQTELVDHLANDIEEIWIENPKLTFEKARDISFKKFGVFGFMNVVEAKHKQLAKKYNNVIWTFMKEWFSIPKTLISATIFLFFYTLMSLNISEDYLSILLLFIAIIDFFLIHQLIKKSKNRFKEKGKKYLLEDIIYRAGAVSSFLVFSNIFNLTLFLRHSNAVFMKIFVSCLITLAILYSYITLFVIPEKGEKLLKATYPEYRFTKSK